MQTGLRPKPSPCFLTAAGETMKPGRSPRAASSGANGFFSSTTTVWGSGALTLATAGSSWLRWGDLVCGSRMRSRFHFTASALRSVPSWNFTPGWSWKVTRLPSGEICHARASSGTTLKLRSRPTSVLQIM